MKRHQENGVVQENGCGLLSDVVGVVVFFACEFFLLVGQTKTKMKKVRNLQIFLLSIHLCHVFF